MIIGTARDAADLLEPVFASASRERLAVLHLDGERRMLALDEAPVDKVDSVGLPVRAIIAKALDLGASGVVIAHNHPSGDPRPSQSDIAATRRLADTAAGVGIRLHDHLIFAGRSCRSFRQLGLL
jgi:DNA repair protein RadC